MDNVGEWHVLPMYVFVIFKHGTRMRGPIFVQFLLFSTKSVDILWISLVLSCIYKTAKLTKKIDFVCDLFTENENKPSKFKCLLV